MKGIEQNKEFISEMHEELIIFSNHISQNLWTDMQQTSPILYFLFFTCDM